MTEFDDFHFVVQPNIQRPGTWNVLLEACPVDGLAGPMGDVLPEFTRQQLISLRSQNGWPDSNKLKAIGQSVAQSLLTPDLRVYSTIVEGQVAYRAG